MTQNSPPDSDVSAGGWTPTPIYEELDEPSPDDSSEVTSGAGGFNVTFEVGLAELAWPKPGQQQLIVRLKRTETGGPPNDPPVRVELKQASSVIAQRTFTPTTSYQNFTVTLTDAEKLLITDYTNLSVQVTYNPFPP